MDYYIGVDGGGTKTHVALFDQTGALVEMNKTTCTNHELLQGGFEEAVELIFTTAQGLLRKYGTDATNAKGWYMGLAGADTNQQIKILTNIFKGKGAHNIVICNDGYLPVLAGTESGVGIAYSLGTGTSVTGIDEMGKMFHIGGFANISGDMGNGTWIQEQVWCAVYDEAFVKGPKTMLTERVQGFVGMSIPEAFEAGLHEKAGETSHKIIQAFFETWDKQDPVARQIGDTMTRRGIQMIIAAIEQLCFKSPVEIVLSGSIHTKAASKAYLTYFEEEISKQYQGSLLFTRPEKSPVHGCEKLVVGKVVLAD